MSQRAKWSAQLIVMLLCALALKLYYSTASPDELRWILAPTTALVELLSGRSFSFESHAGYMSSDHSFLIAASCAGVNFLITGFLVLGLRRLWSKRMQTVSWRFIPFSGLFAYLATLTANTVRICIALELQRHPPEISWLNANQIHRLEGIVVYFAFLLLLFMLTEQTRSSGVGDLFKLCLFPLLIYYLMTLGFPLANGAYKQGAAFWEHFAFVLTSPLLVIALLLGWRVARTARVAATQKPEKQSTEVCV